MTSRPHHEPADPSAGVPVWPDPCPLREFTLSLDLSAALDFSAQLCSTAVQAVQWQYEAIRNGLTQQFEFP